MADPRSSILRYLQYQQIEREGQSGRRFGTEGAVREIGLEFIQFALDQLAAHLPADAEVRTKVIAALETGHPDLGPKASDVADTALRAIANALGEADIGKTAARRA